MSHLATNSLQPVTFDSDQINKLVEHCSSDNLYFYIFIRTKIVESIRNTLTKLGYIEPPVYTLAPCIDPLTHSTELANLNYYGQQVSCISSLIFHKMALLGINNNINKIFWQSPNVRKELNIPQNKLGRYSTEFTQIDFEGKLTYDETINIIKTVIVNLYNDLNLNIMTYNIINKFNPNFLKKQIKYDDIKLYDSSEYTEEQLAKLDIPSILINIKREAYDLFDASTNKYLNYDVIFPHVGEVLSGGSREYEYDKLKNRMIELNYNLEYFSPILTLAEKNLLIPTSGGGFGIERLTRAILKIDNIANLYPFPRIPGEQIIF